MSSRSACTFVLAAAVLASAGFAEAHDPWELENDDVEATTNVMRHGDRQIHDLEGVLPTFDFDWIRVATQLHHSYEARVSGLIWDFDCVLSGCPRLDRVDSAGSVLTAGAVHSDDVPNVDPRYSLGMTVRWTSGGEVNEYLRVRGDKGGGFGPIPYTIVFRDTSLLVPRWNNTGTQVTVFVLQNAQRDTITGSLHLYDAAGALLHAVALSVPPNGVQVISTGSLPGVAGLSGSAAIEHNGGYGGLTGKAVALEPATGFTFDTAITPIPY